MAIVKGTTKPVDVMQLKVYHNTSITFDFVNVLFLQWLTKYGCVFFFFQCCHCHHLFGGHGYTVFQTEDGKDAYALNSLVWSAFQDAEDRKRKYGIMCSLNVYFMRCISESPFFNTSMEWGTLFWKVLVRGAPEAPFHLPHVHAGRWLAAQQTRRAGGGREM